MGAISAPAAPVIFVPVFVPVEVPTDVIQSVVQEDAAEAAVQRLQRSLLQVHNLSQLAKIR